jgi:hypothetical protein
VVERVFSSKELEGCLKGGSSRKRLRGSAERILPCM